MLACIQRRQNLSSQHLTCVPKSLDVPTPPLLLPAPPPPPLCTHKGEPPSAASRYPSPAELDAFARRTASSPLCIKIFPSDIRVPQHKQLSKTVNGLDTTGQSYGTYSQPYAGGYQGLLAIGQVAAAATVKGVVKNSDGKRTKQTHSQGCPTAYKNPANRGYPVRHGHKAHHVSSCKPDVPVETLCSIAGMPSGDHSLLPCSELAEVQSLMRQLNRVPRPGGEARASPSLQAVAAVARSDFAAGVPLTQSSTPFGGAVVPMQGAAHVAQADYAAWQHRHHLYRRGAARMYNLVAADSGMGQSPESCLPLVSSSYGVHPPVQDPFSVKHFFTPLWDGVSATPNSDCCASQVPGTLAPLHPHLGQHHQTHFHPVPVHPQVYGTEQNVCCGPPGASLCHAAALSRSLQSLECLISEIQPPCIKERMLGRGYEAAGTQQMLEQQQQQLPHHHHAHIQLPVYR
ncbi:protein FAM222A [Syngnathoides biaculeatus]|uniref:protein FAM222A n=1 Tax=Syngnathoides biaculeatus TaxID=300417 RepID=UPI002ADE2DCD|nr:protein FAM222A [Syngnathoides biaculeatus]XP_061703725.1 protein FAM222A [Syngnathoides biaculeatus]